MRFVCVGPVTMRKSWIVACSSIPCTSAATRARSSFVCASSVRIGLTAERFRQLLLDVVDEVVHLEDIARGGHLGVQRDHPPAGSVVVYDEVMHAADALVRHDEPFDLLYELLLRRLAEQRADRIARRLHP